MSNKTNSTKAMNENSDLYDLSFSDLYALRQMLTERIDQEFKADFLIKLKFDRAIVQQHIDKKVNYYFNY